MDRDETGKGCVRQTNSIIGEAMNAKVDEKYFMKIAEDVAEASTCRANVGCIIVKDKIIVGMGYVGSVHGDRHCDTHDHILVKAEHRPNGDTCIRTIHAEMNAVLKCKERGDKRNGWLSVFCTHQPCLDCLKVLLQIGVRRIYFKHAYDDKRRDAYILGLNTMEFIDQPTCDRLIIRQVL